MPRWRATARPGVVGPAQRLGEREAVAGGVGVEPADGAVAHAPLRDVEHPLDRHLVGRVHDRPQVGQRVLDLPAVVEAGAADDLVRDAGPHERVLEHPALRVGPVEDRHVAPARVTDLVQLRHLADHPLRLVDLVLGVEADDGLAAALVGPELLRLAAHVVGDDRVGGVEDGLGRAVVLLEQDHRGVGERLLELQDVGDVGATEPIDRVVHEHAVGHVGVRRIDLEVVDRARVALVLDRLDLGSHEPAVPGDEDVHTGSEVAERRERVDATVDARSPPDVQSRGQRRRLRSLDRLGVALEAASHALSPGAGAHRRRRAFDRRTSSARHRREASRCGNSGWRSRSSSRSFARGLRVSISAYSRVKRLLVEPVTQGAVRRSRRTRLPSRSASPSVGRAGSASDPCSTRPRSGAAVPMRKPRSRRSIR